MYLASAAWYDSTTLWAVTGVVVAIAVGIATVWATRKASPRRHKLSCIVRYTSLLTEGNSYGNLLKVTYNEKPVNTPTIVNVWLYNTGRTDISSSSFDDKRPLVIDIGVNILALIPAADGEPLPRDKFQIEGSCVMIGPWLIDAGKWIVATLLVNGIPENVKTTNSLIDTDVTEDVANNVAPARDPGTIHYLSQMLSRHRRQ